MRSPKLIAAALAAVLLIVGVVVFAFGGEDKVTYEDPLVVPGEPEIDVIAPRNGSRQENRAVVVRLEIENFRLAPAHFGMPPQLGEGHIRFALRRVPDCVDPEKLERALAAPTARGRFLGRSFDYPRYSGPNGLLAEQIGRAGIYSPATEPEIYYENLPSGFFRLAINLARNDGSPAPYKAVTYFEVLEDIVGDGTNAPVSTLDEDCPDGKIPSREATLVG